MRRKLSVSLASGCLAVASCLALTTAMPAQAQSLAEPTHYAAAQRVNLRVSPWCNREGGYVSISWMSDNPQKWDWVGLYDKPVNEAGRDGYLTWQWVDGYLDYEYVTSYKKGTFYAAYWRWNYGLGRYILIEEGGPVTC
jgi:hypothetical protein